MAYLPFLLLLGAVLGCWVHHNVAVALLALAVIAAWFTGALQGLAPLWIALLGLLAWLHGSRAGWQRAAAGAAFLVLAVAMALLLIPGFPRTVIAADVVLSPGAAPYTLGLGFAKVVTGIFVLAFIHPGRVRSWRELAGVLARVAPVFLATCLAVMVLTLVLGYVRWDPKWTPLFVTWALANLFFTCFSEEALFRGFVQRELAQLGKDRRVSSGLALAVTSLLFGLAHLGGGWTYALAATLAGLGYGIAYQRTQRIEGAMAVHFGLNATHFLLFTYPALATTT